jgi:hypothetical protein
MVLESVVGLERLWGDLASVDDTGRGGSVGLRPEKNPEMPGKCCDEFSGPWGRASKQRG